MKINNKQHITKDGIVKKNPAKKKSLDLTILPSEIQYGNRYYVKEENSKDIISYLQQHTRYAIEVFIIRENGFLSIQDGNDEFSEVKIKDTNDKNEIRWALEKFLDKLGDGDDDDEEQDGWH